MSDRLPAPSVGVATAPLGSDLVVFDPRRTEVHVLNETGALVWAACAAGLGAAEAASALAARADAPAAVVAREVEGLVATLVDRGLLGATEPAAAVSTPSDAPTGAPAVPLAVLDRVVAVEADDELRDAVARAFRHLVTDRTPDRRLSIDRTTRGLRLHGGGHDAVHGDRGGLLDALASQLNRVATTSRALLALHAAAVRSPRGEVVVVVGGSGAGKSTLAAALVADGWDYLTDEAVGVSPGGEIVGYPKPLALDAASRGLVGIAPAAGGGELVGPEAVRADVTAVAGDPGPVALVAVVDRTERGIGEPSSLADAVAELAGHALNLHAARGVGLDALVALVEAAPVRRLGTNDLVSAVRDLGRPTHLS